MGPEAVWGEGIGDEDDAGVFAVWGDGDGVVDEDCDGDDNAVADAVGGFRVLYGEASRDDGGNGDEVFDDDVAGGGDVV